MLKYLGGQSPSAYTAWFATFSTATIADDGTGLAEPTAGTGGYTVTAITWTTVPLPTAGQPAVLGNSGTINWGGSSSAAWSTGATVLPVVGVYNSATLRVEAANFIGAMGVTTPRAVAAAGITLESLAGDLQFTLTPT